VLGASETLWMLAAAWLLLGIGMGLGLYEAAFGALGRIYGDKARKAITDITLIAGFASTVGWPLTSFGQDAIGWRGTCFAWAAAHIFDRPSAQHVLPAKDRAAAAGRRPSGEAAHPDRPHDGSAVVGFGMLIEPLGRGVVGASALLSLAALVALMLLPAKANAEAAAETA
jgi:predicted MFS family arabinose efflux permease